MPLSFSVAYTLMFERALAGTPEREDTLELTLDRQEALRVSLECDEPSELKLTLGRNQYCLFRGIGPLWINHLAMFIR